MGRVWIPHGAMYGRWGPDVGGSELYGACGSEAVWMCRLPRSGNLSPGRSASARYANQPTAAATTTTAAIDTPCFSGRSALRRALAPLPLPWSLGIVPLPGGGSVWESNPPPTCLEPDTGFEVREAHRVPRRFRRSSTHLARSSLSVPSPAAPETQPGRPGADRDNSGAGRTIKECHGSTPAERALGAWGPCRGPM